VIAQRGAAGQARLKADRQSATDRLAALVGERLEGLAHERGVDVVGLRRSATELLDRIAGLDVRLADESMGAAAQRGSAPKDELSQARRTLRVLVRVLALTPPGYPEAGRVLCDAIQAQFRRITRARLELDKQLR
jgi:hypothetical protein